MRKNNQFKTRVYDDGSMVELFMGHARYLVTFGVPRSVPFVWHMSNPDIARGFDVRIPRTDKRYAAALRIALSAIYRVDITV